MQPPLIAEIEYRSWTDDGKLRRFVLYRGCAKSRIMRRSIELKVEHYHDFLHELRMSGSRNFKTRSAGRLLGLGFHQSSASASAHRSPRRANARIARFIGRAGARQDMTTAAAGLWRVHRGEMVRSRCRPSMGKTAVGLGIGSRRLRQARVSGSSRWKKCIHFFRLSRGGAAWQLVRAHNLKAAGSNPATELPGIGP